MLSIEETSNKNMNLLLMWIQSKNQNKIGNIKYLQSQIRCYTVRRKITDKSEIFSV